MSIANLEEYHRPETLGEVIKLLSTYQDEALIVSGGTFIHGLFARGLIVNVKHLVDITGLKIDHIHSDNDRLIIGATALFRQLEENSVVRNDIGLGAIKDALTYPPAQVKNAASIGGCVASACPFLDLPISLLVLNASAKTFGIAGERDIKLEEFFVSLFENSMEENEVLRELIVPLSCGKSASAFEKLETNANDLAILNAAVSVTIEDSVTEKVRIFVGGGVGEVPVRATSAESILKGKALSLENIEEAARCAKEDVDPLSDHRASAEYRKAMTEVLVKRCLIRSLNRLSDN